MWGNEDKEEEQEECKVKLPIYLDSQLDMKLRYLSRSLDTEIAGWLTGEITKEGIFIKDILIPEQEVGGASVDISPSAGAKLRTEFGDKCTKIIGHWHSHCDFGTSWSGFYRCSFLPQSYC